MTKLPDFGDKQTSDIKQSKLRASERKERFAQKSNEIGEQIQETETTLQYPATKMNDHFSGLCLLRIQKMEATIILRDHFERIPKVKEKTSINKEKKKDKIRELNVIDPPEIIFWKFLIIPGIGK